MGESGFVGWSALLKKKRVMLCRLQTFLFAIAGAIQ